MDAFEKYLNVALRYLSYRPRSEKELKDYLKRKKVEPLVLDKILLKLYENKFLDDTEFVKWWVEQRTKIRPRGIRIIKAELRQKGISDEMIESGIMNQESGAKNDLGLARKLIEKRLLRYKNLSKQELYQKLGAFLGRRGFDWDTIKKAIDDVTKKGV